MKSATKKITRASKDSAFKAMEKHAEKMLSKGWKIDKEFAGNRGCNYECITYFYK